VIAVLAAAVVILAWFWVVGFWVLIHLARLHGESMFEDD
jgi:hypothetical protein